MSEAKDCSGPLEPSVQGTSPRLIEVVEDVRSCMKDALEEKRGVPCGVVLGHEGDCAHERQEAKVAVDATAIKVARCHDWVMLARYDMESTEALEYVEWGSIPFPQERMQSPDSIVGPVCYACEAAFKEAAPSCPGDPSEGRA